MLPKLFARVSGFGALERPPGPPGYLVHGNLENEELYGRAFMKLHQIRVLSAEIKRRSLRSLPKREPGAYCGIDGRWRKR